MLFRSTLDFLLILGLAHVNEHIFELARAENTRLAGLVNRSTPIVAQHLALFLRLGVHLHRRNSALPHFGLAEHGMRVVPPFGSKDEIHPLIRSEESRVGNEWVST